MRASGCRVCAQVRTGSPSTPRDGVCCWTKVKFYPKVAGPHHKAGEHSSQASQQQPTFPACMQKTFFAPFQLQFRALRRKD